MIFAVIPAGGKSRRMGRPKLALPAGNCTVLERVVRTLRAAEIEPILVVLGPHVLALKPLAEAAGAQVSILPEETPDMRSTVDHGLRWLEETQRPGPDDAWLLVPADHPTLEESVVRQLLRARLAHPDRSIFMPTFAGKRGHPVVIGWKHVALIRAMPPGLGLNAYLRGQGDQTLDVVVASAEILRDLDTPEDYERLRQHWEQ